MSKMQAVILAGGKGTRLKPYTTVFPKPLMPIGDKPILEIMIRQLKHFDFQKIILTVGYQKELIRAFFNDGEKWGLKITYSQEEKPLGTAGPLRLIPRLPDNFLVMNGDVLTDMDFKAFYQFHTGQKALCTITTYQKPVHIALGVVKTDQNDHVIDYVEKPTFKYSVSMGVYAFRKRIADYIPYNQYLDFPDLIKILLANKEKVLAYRFDGRWLDIGRAEDYEKALDEFENYKDIYLK